LVTAKDCRATTKDCKVLNKLLKTYILSTAKDCEVYSKLLEGQIVATEKTLVCASRLLEKNAMHPLNGEAYTITKLFNSMPSWKLPATHPPSLVKHVVPSIWSSPALEFHMLSADAVE